MYSSKPPQKVSNKQNKTIFIIYTNINKNEQNGRNNRQYVFVQLLFFTSLIQILLYIHNMICFK